MGDGIRTELADKPNEEEWRPGVERLVERRVEKRPTRVQVNPRPILGGRYRDPAAKARLKAFAKCSKLAASNDILGELASALKLSGFAGDTTNAKRLYLALTTRLFDDPVSVVIKGPSGGGKSALLKTVLGFFPDSAFYPLSAMSPKALVYLKEPISHRFLIVQEAPGVANEMTNYLLRTLLSEGHIRYETVVSGRTKLFEQAGPTGLLVTTTASGLHEENETRVLSLLVEDTREQTKAILLAQAAHHMRQPVPRIDWLALQTWLEAGSHRVHIPFKRTLADLTLPTVVRLRRDFPKVLNLISAHTLLHQASRRVTNDGRPTAETRDYAAVYELMHDIVAEGAETSVSETVRQVVECVRGLSATGRAVQLAAICKQLELGRNEVLRRVNDATAKGYLIIEPRGFSNPMGGIVLGDPLPEQLEILPTPAALSSALAAAAKKRNHQRFVVAKYE